MRNLYQTKEARDAAYRALKAKGIVATRSRSGPAQLHPMYIADYDRELSEADKGFGNNIYKTYFPMIYTLEWTV